MTIRRILSVLLFVAALAAQDGQTVINVNGTVIHVPPGSNVTVIGNGFGTQVITTDATAAVVTPAPKSGVTVTNTQAVPRTNPWDLDVGDGVRFGGIIGASLDSTLSYDSTGLVDPELSADVGVSGATVGLGARWSLSEKQWTLSNQGLSIDYDSHTAIVTRLIAPYRWEGRKRSPSLWHGMTSDSGWYYGGEVDVLVDSVAIAVQMTWEEEHHHHDPRFTLSYGFGW